MEKQEAKNGKKRVKRTAGELREIRRAAALKRWGAGANVEFDGGFRSVSVPKWIAELLKDEADRRGCSMSKLVREAVAAYFRRCAGNG